MNKTLTSQAERISSLARQARAQGADPHIPAGMDVAAMALLADLLAGPEGDADLAALLAIAGIRQAAVIESALAAAVEGRGI